MEIPFVRARWFTATTGRKVDLIVIHDMEMPEATDTAERCARYFSTSTTKASAHYCIDNNSVVQCVYDRDVAWAAPGSNNNGIHLEHAGYANQRAVEWADTYSKAELALSASLCAQLCQKHGIPPVFVPASKLLEGDRGITTHAEVSRAWRKSTHTDPGPNFPLGQYVDMVRTEMMGPPKEAVLQVNAPVIGILAHPSWDGYALVGSDGGVFSFEAPNFGALGNVQLNSPVVAAEATPSGQGYMLIGADGGVFGFGDAEFHGGHGPEAENAPFVGMRFHKTAAGYWLAGRDGGVFTYGDAPFKGSVQYSGG